MSWGAHKSPLDHPASCLPGPPADMSVMALGCPGHLEVPEPAVLAHGKCPGNSTQEELYTLASAREPPIKRALGRRVKEEENIFV